MDLLAQRVAHEQALGRPTRASWSPRPGPRIGHGAKASSKRSARRSRSAAKQSWPRPSTRSPRYSASAVSERAVRRRPGRPRTRSCRGRRSRSAGCRACPARSRGSHADRRRPGVRPWRTSHRAWRSAPVEVASESGHRSAAMASRERGRRDSTSSANSAWAWRRTAGWLGRRRVRASRRPSRLTRSAVAGGWGRRVAWRPLRSCRRPVRSVPPWVGRRTARGCRRALPPFPDLRG